MRHNQRIDLILATINHENNRLQNCRYLWVGSLAMAKLRAHLALEPHENINEALEAMRVDKSAIARVNRAFQFLSPYIMDMGVFEDYFRPKPPEGAIETCERWFSYLERQRKDTETLQRAASLARKGQVQEARRLKSQVDSQPHVFDGASLYPAVKALVQCFTK